MSSAERQQGITVDVNAIYTQLQALAEEITRLRGIEAQLRAMLDSVRRAKDTLDAFVRNGRGADILIPLDPQMNGFGYAKVGDSERFIVGLGLGYFAEVDASRGLDILSSKERALINQLEILGKSLSEYMQLYQQYRQVLASILAAGARSGSPRREG